MYCLSSFTQKHCAIAKIYKEKTKREIHLLYTNLPYIRSDKAYLNALNLSSIFMKDIFSVNHLLPSIPVTIDLDQLCNKNVL